MEAGEEKCRKTKKKKKHKKKKSIGTAGIVIGVFGAVVLLLLLIAVVLYFSGKSRLFAATAASLPVLSSVEEQEAERRELGATATDWQDNWVAIDGKVYEYNTEIINLLFLGIDDKGEIAGKTDYETYKAGQADAIFLLSLNPTDKTMKIIGIPRNSMVPLNVYDGDGQIVDSFTNQICLQYAYAGGGLQGLQEMNSAVSGLLCGLPIHGEFAVGFDAISIINDMLGGVTVDVLETIEYNPELVEGRRVHLMGQSAIDYVQGRDVTQLGSPTKRLLREKQYLLELTNVAKAKIRENPLIIRKLYTTMLDYMNTDVAIDEVVYLATQAVGYSFGEESFYMLEGEDRRVDYVNEDGEADFYDDLYLKEESLRDTLLHAFYTEVHLE